MLNFYLSLIFYFFKLAEAEKNNKASERVPRYGPQTARVLSLSDILYRSEANNDASLDGSRSEREDPDNDEELELDFENDEGRDVESNILHGSLNLRIHRRGNSTRDTSASGSCGSPSLSSQNDRAAYQVHIYTSNRHMSPVLVNVVI